MAYFDSPKNKALWDKELESLDAERERRKAEGYKPQRKGAQAGNGAYGTALDGRDNPRVRRITLKQLEEIERQASGRQSDAADGRQRARKAAERRHEAEKIRQETAAI